MVNLKEKWSETSRQNKINLIITVILSFVVIVMSIIGLLGIIDIRITNSITIPMLGIITLLNGIKMYKTNKAVGIFAFCCAVFIFICCVAVFWMKQFPRL